KYLEYRIFIVIWSVNKLSKTKIKIMKYTLSKSLLLLGAFLCFSMAKGQTLTVNGRVSDQSGPLGGVNVLVKGTTTGTQTDFDGNFTLNNVDSNATLVFSYLGLKTQEVQVNGQETLDITMSEDTNELDEVVIIGYGTSKKSDLTGSVGQVNAERLEERPATSL